MLQGTYTDEQIDALASAACKEQGVNLGIESRVTLAAYQPADLGGAGDMQRSVLLESITAESGINAIKKGSKLSVATSGITLVYGNNGSGKSGFSRIIRNSCTSRSGSSEILANVFDGNDTPSAIFSLIVDGVPTSCAWRSGRSDYPAYPEIAFFDATCAAMEVNDRDNEILYVPSVISSLMNLSALVSAVAARIRRREDELTDTISMSMGLVPQEHCKSPRAATLLSCESGAEAEKLVNDAQLSPQEAERYADLPRLIKANPGVEISKLERRQAQLSAMRQRLAELYKCCQPAFSEAYISALGAVQTAQETAKAAAQLASSNSQLDGFGGDVWKALWEAARKYSNECAHTSTMFPKLSQGSLCPLCQQPLGDEAIARMDAFDTYVTGVAEKQVTKKRKSLDALTRRFIDAAAAVKADKGSIVALETAQAVLNMDSLMLELESITAFPDASTLAKLTSLIESIGTQVGAEIDVLSQRLDTLREIEQPGSVSRMRAELADLDTRSWIYANKDVLIEDAKKRELKAALEAVRKKCTTRQISALVSSVSQVEVVEKMKAAFVDELTRLHAKGQQVTISTRVKSGQEYQRITLEGAEEPARNVLSEGEQKIVALAGFFALLDVLPGNSTVILDDPMTSLDHLWRRAAAARIVEVAESRPVVIFTHEPIFCIEISELAGKLDLPIEYRTIYKMGASAGIVSDGLDWAACNLKQRISLLKNESSKMKTRFKAGEFATDAALENELRQLYSKLRSTWERAVEAALLDGIVERAKLPVQTQKLKKLVDISDSDVRIVEENMGKCSRLTEAHDDPLVAPDAPPSIDEFEQDVRVLADWVSSIRKRR